MSIVKHLKSTLVQRVPILSWAPTYTSEKLVSDAIAGITVGLTVMPQALAYATLAGLEPQVTTFDSHRSVEMFSTETLAFLMLLLQYGLYSAFVGCFVYTIFGTCKDITIGPTALMALMTYQQIAGRNTDYAMLLCFLTGVVQLVMAILHLGTNGINWESLMVRLGFRGAYRFYLHPGDRGLHVGDLCDNNDLSAEKSVGFENLFVRFFGHHYQSY